ncbi:hypothetical protein H072_8786 [Dactylellina haptotyla CBS 200.50]|uniref:Uncharacterized protein n=1 Tax=Dactylellina haptotyla (strain CBS 200.50) TaxID=1284197 RepID=S8A3C7_DACHA|nr:hypothetical protein H072_8786 [Dactylellina haptotyla CBS 200.50]
MTHVLITFLASSVAQRGFVVGYMPQGYKEGRTGQDRTTNRAVGGLRKAAVIVTISKPRLRQGSTARRSRQTLLLSFLERNGQARTLIFAIYVFAFPTNHCRPKSEWCSYVQHANPGSLVDPRVMEKCGPVMAIGQGAKAGDVLQPGRCTSLVELEAKEGPV